MYIHTVYKNILIKHIGLGLIHESKLSFLTMGLFIICLKVESLLIFQKNLRKVTIVLHLFCLLKHFGLDWEAHTNEEF